MPEAHSKWSASGFKKIMLCPGSKVLEVGAADNTTIYAAEGTAAHELLELVLTGETPAAGYVGRIIQADGFDIEVADEMAEYIQAVADRVRDYQGEDGVLFVEQQLHYAEYLGVPHDEGWGTGDVVIARGDEIIVIDLKYGKGLAVDVERNPQLMLYGLGALAKFNGIAGDFTRVRLVIEQPRISSKPSEWDCSVEELEHWGRTTARSAVETCESAKAVLVDDEVPTQSRIWQQTFLHPGEDQCRFCKAKAKCPALRAEVAVAAFNVAPATPDEFAELEPAMPDEQDSPDWIAACLSRVDLIEDWCKAIRAEAERRMLEGGEVPGYKLVAGKRGPRKWANAKEAEEVMKSMRLKLEEMYDLSLISPTTAEKLAKAKTIGPRQWNRLVPLITQSDGKTHVAPVSDERPALDVKPVTDDFVVESLADLA